MLHGTDLIFIQNKDSKYCYQPAGDIVTGYEKIIIDSRIPSIICKRPKYKFLFPKDFNQMSYRNILSYTRMLQARAC